MNERKFYQQVGVECTKTYQQPDTKEAKQSWSKIGEQKNRMDKQKGIRVTRIWRRPQVENTLQFTWSNSQKTTKLEIVRPWWHTWILVLKKSLPSITDWLSRWIDTLKLHIYPNGWRKERPHWSKKEPPETTKDP